MNKCKIECGACGEETAFEDYEQQQLEIVRGAFTYVYLGKGEKVMSCRKCVDELQSKLDKYYDQAREASRAFIDGKRANRKPVLESIH